jgi:hypothetical protein
MISILIFPDDVVLLATSPEGLLRQLDALTLLCDLRQLTANLGKTKVTIFNGSKKFVDPHFFFRGEEIEITNASCTWECDFQDPVSICNLPSSFGLPRDMVL